MHTINLYLLPFAGGSKYSYREYMKLAPDFLNIIPVEIPGRGSRTNEKPLTDLEPIAEDIFEQMVLDEPYAIYGHSMGGLLLFLLTQKIIRENRKLPLHLFVTGCAGPSVPDRDLVPYWLPRAEFFQRIKDLGGATEAVLNHPELLDFIEPILRADVQAVASFKYRHVEPFPIPISVAIGSGEKVTPEEAATWQKETTLPVEVKRFPGNHFFIFDHEMAIMKIISGKLNYEILT